MRSSLNDWAKGSISGRLPLTAGGAVQMVQNLEGMGFTWFPLDRDVSLWGPFKQQELMKLTLEQKLAHGGHPVLRWMMDNIFIRTDPGEISRQIRKSPRRRLTGAIATIMGLDRAIRCGNDTSESVYGYKRTAGVL